MSFAGFQREVCARLGADFAPPGLIDKLGIAEDVRTGVLPINGLRHEPVGETSGWFIWAGSDPGPEDEYFHPLHVTHVDEWYPGLSKYLALPPGWRFQIAPGHEDLWFDKSLLTTRD